MLQKKRMNKNRILKKYNSIRTKKNIVFLIHLALLFCIEVKAQDEKRVHFIGINPSVTVEPFYEKGELDLNIFPVVYQTPFSKRVDLRLTSVLNLGIRKTKNQLSHYGIETAFPIFFKSKTSKNECSKGFFIAPIISITRNEIGHHSNAGIWLEPGYNFLFDNKFAITIGPQIGATYFHYDSSPGKWGNHFGFKFVFGKWL